MLNNIVNTNAVYFVNKTNKTVTCFQNVSRCDVTLTQGYDGIEYRLDIEGYGTARIKDLNEIYPFKDISEDELFALIEEENSKI